MDSSNSHPWYANRPSEQPHNLLPVVSLRNQGPCIAGQQRMNWSSFRTFLEQRGLQMEQVLQAHNQQVKIELKQQMSLQKETLLNLAESMSRDVLIKKNDEIAHLHMELHNTQQVLQTALQDRDEWTYLAEGTYELNLLLGSMVPPMQGTNSYAHGSSIELNYTSSCNQAMNMEEATLENTHPTVICRLCCALDACMLILPCLHLCACKSCGVNLSMCPICNSAKANVIEARIG